MKRSRLALIVFALVLTLEIFLSSKFIYFTDDNGTGNHTGGKNPQTAVVLSVQSQRFANYKITPFVTAKQA